MKELEIALKRFAAKTSSASYDGGTELAKIDLAPHSIYWEEILLRLLGHKSGHLALEKSISKIGKPIIPLLETTLGQVKGEKAVPILRILGDILHQDGHNIYLEYSNKSGVVRNTALRLFAQYFPVEASPIVLKASQSESKNEEELIVALLLLQNRDGFLKAQELRGRSFGHTRTTDLLSKTVLENIADCAIEQLKSSSTSLPMWPFDDIPLTSELSKKLPPKKFEEYLLALLRHPISRIKREATIALAERSNSEGLTMLQQTCLDDYYTAKAAVAACNQLGIESFFDWFSEALAQTPTQDLLSVEKAYGFVLSRLQPIIHKDKRWSAWLAVHIGPQYTYLDSLRKAMQAPEVQLQSVGPENLKSLELLAAQKSPLVFEWIDNRIISQQVFSREEYFSIVESLRLLNDPSGCKALEKLVERFNPSGFAKDFADEVLAKLR